MILLRCPRCHACTPAEDDATKVACWWCHLWVGPVDRHAVRDPAAVRKFVLDDLRPIASLMLTFGIGQTLTAVIYLWVFASWMSEGHVYLIGNFEQNPLVYAIGVVLLVGGVFIIAGGVALRRGRGRLYAVVGAIFTLASPLLLGIPIGAWALWKLGRPEVRAAFKSSPPSAS